MSSPASTPTAQPVLSKATILDVQELDAGYGRSQVLSKVDLTAKATGGIALLGRNGAGKSTLLKTLIGEIQAMQGTIWFDGQNAHEHGTEWRVRQGMGYVPQEQAVFGKLTVRENLLLGAVRQKDKSGIDMVLDFFPKLGQRLEQTAGTLSGGERKMLAIGRALLGKPRLLMLDEPTEGVWIGVIEEIAERLRALTSEMSVILVEQHVELALRVADYAYVMDRGTIALQGPAAEVKDDPRLLRYLAP
ncbi:ABC transporter ATP-binding protein [Algihabitans sp.]|uniref:ABC transporter ATP-binding protein n=1 Tax=Algihabitans sp. TaxID=2821514 RepID=UPI003BAB3701